MARTIVARAGGVIIQQAARERLWDEVGKWYIWLQQRFDPRLKIAAYFGGVSPARMALNLWRSESSHGSHAIDLRLAAIWLR